MSSTPRLGFLHGGAFHQLAALADPAVRAWRPGRYTCPRPGRTTSPTWTP
ncbi:hypothetical protein NKH18_05015 [Streptomyces sp. M10(2022)]